MINIAQETLGFRRTDFSSVFSLLIPAYSLPGSPVVLADLPSPRLERSSTNPSCDGFHSFGDALEPR